MKSFFKYTLVFAVVLLALPSFAFVQITRHDFFDEFFFETIAISENTFSKILCRDPTYTCITIKKGATWESLWPDEKEREIIMKINRRNVELFPGMQIAIPNTHLTSKTHMDFPPFPPSFNTKEKKIIFIDLNILAWGAYYNETLVNWGPLSGGKEWCDDIKRPCRTPHGTRKILAKYGPDKKSKKYPLKTHGGAPMPWFMPFSSAGYGLHGSNDVPGYNASHGCVRLFVKDAEWLNEEFAEVGVTVIIK